MKENNQCFGGNMIHKNPITTNEAKGHKFITIGEIMLRLTPPNYEKIRMTHSFEASYGGAEANIGGIAK